MINETYTLNCSFLFAILFGVVKCIIQLKTTALVPDFWTAPYITVYVRLQFPLPRHQCKSEREKVSEVHVYKRQRENT